MSAQFTPELARRPRLWASLPGFVIGLCGLIAPIGFGAATLVFALGQIPLVSLPAAPAASAKAIHWLVVCLLGGVMSAFSYVICRLNELYLQANAYTSRLSRLGSLSLATGALVGLAGAATLAGLHTDSTKTGVLCFVICGMATGILASLLAALLYMNLIGRQYSSGDYTEEAGYTGDANYVEDTGY